MFLAKTPFDRPGADITLRSSDLVDFRVRSTILIEASFTIPGRDLLLNGPTVIPLPEKARVLNILLRFCYPVVRPSFDPSDPQSVIEVWRAAKKYRIAHAEVELATVFKSCAEKGPLNAYMLACRNSWPEGVKIAARATLAHQLSPKDLLITELKKIEDIPGMKFITSTEIVKLQGYHEECGRASSELIEIVQGHPHAGSLPEAPNIGMVALPWLSWDKPELFICPHMMSLRPTAMEKVKIKDGQERSAAKWWTEYMRQMRERLKYRPSGATCHDTKLFSCAIKNSLDHYCQTCKRHYFDDFRIFANKLSERIEKKLDGVS